MGKQTSTLDNGQLTIDNRHWTELTMDNGHPIFNIKLLTLNIGNWIFDKGHLTLNNGHIWHGQNGQ